MVFVLKHTIIFCRNTPLLILYEDDGGDLKDPKKLPQNVKAVRVKPSHAFGHHHTLVYHHSYYR